MAQWGGATPANWFVWNGDVLEALLNADGSAIETEYSYYPGLDNLHAVRTPSGGQLYAHTDALGNVVALTNPSKQVRRSCEYDEWGRLIAGADTEGLNGRDRARFKGALWLGHPTVELYYMRNRWYEPRSGRFLSEDPIGLAGGVNLYAFGASDPINNWDPTGTDCVRYSIYRIRRVERWNVDHWEVEETITYVGSYYVCDDEFKEAVFAWLRDQQRADRFALRGHLPRTLPPPGHASADNENEGVDDVEAVRVDMCRLAGTQRNLSAAAGLGGVGLAVAPSASRPGTPSLGGSVGAVVNEGLGLAGASVGGDGGGWGIIGESARNATFYQKVFLGLGCGG